MNKGYKNRKLLLTLLVVVFLTMLGAMAISLENIAEKSQELSAKEKNIDIEIQKALTEQDNIKLKIEYIGTRAYIEEQARDRLGLLYPNEIIIKPKD